MKIIKIKKYNKISYIYDTLKILKKTNNYYFCCLIKNNNIYVSPIILIKSFNNIKYINNYHILSNNEYILTNIYASKINNKWLINY
jgi:hypothetical protein